MTTRTDRKVREWLACTALCYAILGNRHRSETIRRLLMRPAPTPSEKQWRPEPILV